MHYVRTLCDRYFLSYDNVSLFLTGRFRHRLLKHGVGIEWDPRSTAAYLPFHFDALLSHFTLLFSWNFDFSGTTYHTDSKPVPLDLACLKPYIHATQIISMHFSQSKSTKCEIFGSLLNSPWQKRKKMSICTGKKCFKKAWKSPHLGFWVCQSQCTMLELCVTGTFWVMTMFLYFWQAGLDIGFWNMV